MNTITLSDYVGYIFSEIVTARMIADERSKTIAEIYAKDAVLSNFSVPRFKIPEMNLTIPVLVVGAKFTNLRLSNSSFKLRGISVPTIPYSVFLKKSAAFLPIGNTLTFAFL